MTETLSGAAPVQEPEIEEEHEGQPDPPALPQNVSADWNAPLEAAVCERCDWSYLFRAGFSPDRCPHCFAPGLTPLGEQVEQLPHHAPPELVLPFNVPDQTLALNIRTFAGKIPYAPDDLNLTTLRSRLKTLYLPMWLVDSRVEAAWQAEMGFNYEVVSHQAQYQQTRATWRSKEVIETRIRWESRLGRLARPYHNIAAPALEESAEIEKQLGKYDLSPTQPYRAESISRAFVRLPGRSTGDAWADAAPAFRSTAADECRRAASADHVRDYRWTPDFGDLNWTLLLLPVYSTYYFDDDGNPQPVFIHGQSGQLSGARRASVKRAQRTMWIIIGVAGVLFAISLILTIASLFLPALLVIGVLGFVTALFVALVSLFPIVIAWHFNRSEERKPLF